MLLAICATSTRYVLIVPRTAQVLGFVPKELFFTKGVGKHREKLTSFELALRSAGIAACNLVRVSSIFPPGCHILPRADGARRLKPGQVTFVVMSEAATREPHRLIAATIGVAIPRDPKLYGYLSEHHSYGKNEEEAGDYAEDLAAAADLPSGTMLIPQMLTQLRPASGIPPASLEDVIGRSLKKAVKSGQIISWSDLA